MHRVDANPYRPRDARRHQLQLWVAVVSVCASATLAHAEAPAGQRAQAPSAVLLATAGSQGSGSALDSVIQAALEQLGVVRVVARPGLDLSAVQLVLDCVAETPQCLRAVTEQHAAEVLIAPNLARTSGELVLSFLRFDTRDGQMRRVLHRQQGQALTSETLDAVPGMLREVFGLPEPTPVAQAELPPDDLSPLPEAPMEPPGNATRFVGPLVLGGAGIVALGTAVGFGLSALGAQDDYDRLVAKMPKREGEVNAVVDAADSGKARATVANVLYGVGGAALFAAGIWLVVDLATTGEPTPRDHAKLVQPWLGPHQVGLVFTHRGAGL